VRITTVQWDARDPTALWPQIAAERADLLVLPELGLAPWLPDTPDADADRWALAVAQHETLIARLADLRARVIVGSRPVVSEGRRYNESYVWSDGRLLGGARRKTYLPDEPGYWEATWYERGPAAFAPIDTPLGRLGIMLCTEMWFFQYARALGAAGIDVLAVPRATPAASVSKWVAGGRAAAVVAGAYCVSANQTGDYTAAAMGGGSWVIEPEEGDLLALSSTDQPIVTCDIDLARARAAKHTYPRYVVG
jgi:N-carbamoylputrescine amidase